MALTSPAKFLRVIADRKQEEKNSCDEFTQQIRNAFQVPKGILEEKISTDGRRISAERRDEDLVRNAETLREHKQKVFAERRKFFEALTASGIGVQDFMRLVEDASANRADFIRRIVHSPSNQNVKTLQDVMPKIPATQLLCVVRTLYANDEAVHIPLQAAMEIVVDEILLHT